MISFRQFFTEQQSKYVILLPGGYKPPTKGHVHMIKSYNDNPLVEKVIVLIGPKEREGIVREQSLKIFKLYGVNELSKVEIDSTNFENPMVAAFEFVQNNPKAKEYAGLTFAIGASNKGDDAKRATRLVDYFQKNPNKLKQGLKVGVPPIVDALETPEGAVSATDLREAIRNKDLETISKLIPSDVSSEEFLSIFNK